ncbi:MAG: hypothetical protein ACI849_000624 [Patiriisocius sp.]|jgi:hypothetical protein
MPKYNQKQLKQLNNMESDSISENIEKTRDKGQEYIETTAAYYKLRFFKSAMLFSTSLLNIILLGSIFLLCFAFISIGFSLIISEAIGVSYAGFLIMGACYLLIFICVYFFGKEPLKNAVLSKFSEIFSEEEKQNKD